MVLICDKACRPELFQRTLVRRQCRTIRKIKINWKVSFLATMFPIPNSCRLFTLTRYWSSFSKSDRLMQLLATRISDASFVEFPKQTKWHRRVNCLLKQIFVQMASSFHLISEQLSWKSISMMFNAYMLQQLAECFAASVQSLTRCNEAKV